MCQPHSRDRLVSHDLPESLDLLRCQPNTRVALTVSNLLPCTGNTREDRERENVPHWIFLGSRLTVGLTALLNCPPKAAVWRRAGPVAHLCWQTEELAHAASCGPLMVLAWVGLCAVKGKCCGMFCGGMSPLPSWQDKSQSRGSSSSSMFVDPSKTEWTKTDFIWLERAEQQLILITTHVKQRHWYWKNYNLMWTVIKCSWIIHFKLLPRYWLAGVPTLAHISLAVFNLVTNLGN